MGVASRTDVGIGVACKDVARIAGARAIMPVIAIAVQQAARLRRVGPPRRRRGPRARPRRRLAGRRDRAVDGLLLPGGGDVLPSIYGAAAHPTFIGRGARTRRLRNRARCAARIDADLPLLAICRGIQVLNVARGGTLVQDIPDEVGTTVNHGLRDAAARDRARSLDRPTGSLLERLMRERLEAGDACPVNSRHHQAPKTLGEGLVASATAPDGVIEAIEDPSRRFCLGVQWHPENFYRTGEFRPLFEGFIEAASK